VAGRVVVAAMPLDLGRVTVSGEKQAMRARR
jgi:hypothetical protein